MRNAPLFLSLIVMLAASSALAQTASDTLTPTTQGVKYPASGFHAQKSFEGGSFARERGKAHAGAHPVIGSIPTPLTSTTTTPLAASAMTMAPATNGRQQAQGNTLRTMSLVADKPPAAVESSDR